MSQQLVAMYARVSSEQQAGAKTIASQVAALQARVAEDGSQLPSEREFLDEGYSGGEARAFFVLERRPTVACEHRLRRGRRGVAVVQA